VLLGPTRAFSPTRPACMLSLCRGKCAPHSLLRCASARTPPPTGLSRFVRTVVHSTVHFAIAPTGRNVGIGTLGYSCPTPLSPISTSGPRTAQRLAQFRLRRLQPGPLAPRPVLSQSGLLRQSACTHPGPPASQCLKGGAGSLSGAGREIGDRQLRPCFHWQTLERKPMQPNHSPSQPSGSLVPTPLACAPAASQASS
jgi:hypothetical protein